MTYVCVTITNGGHPMGYPDLFAYRSRLVLGLWTVRRAHSVAVFPKYSSAKRYMRALDKRGYVDADYV